MRDLNWPPTEIFEYEAENPTRENGLVINAERGGNPKKSRKKGQAKGNQGASR